MSAFRRALFLTYAVAAFAAIPLSFSCSASQAGPLGGDVVPLNDGEVRAEVLANAETGEIVVHTWDAEADERQPMTAEPWVVGKGDQRVLLEPSPLETDPPGRCSRFYGQADWMRGGEFETGWLALGEGDNAPRHGFSCRRCWDAGQQHASAWKMMADQHRQRMGGRGGPRGGPR